MCFYMGAVVGYGVALQASCLEGFDSLGLHQTYWASCRISVRSSKPDLVGSIPTWPSNFNLGVLSAWPDGSPWK